MGDLTLNDELKVKKIIDDVMSMSMNLEIKIGNRNITIGEMGYKDENDIKDPIDRRKKTIQHTYLKCFVIEGLDLNNYISDRAYPQLLKVILSKKIYVHNKLVYEKNFKKEDAIKNVKLMILERIRVLIKFKNEFQFENNKAVAHYLYDWIENKYFENAN